MSPRAVRSLYASLIGVRRLPEDTQKFVLETMERIVWEKFGGSAELPFVTVLYRGGRR
ncbi:MAG: hypothetical protein ACLPVF_14665 [Acidimicrobiales bacterium]